MRLVARKPCSFDGMDFFIGDEIPEGLVMDPSRQEGLGVISVLTDTGGTAAEAVGEIFTREQVDRMIAEAVAEAERGHEERATELQRYVAEMKATEPGNYEGTVLICVKSASDGENMKMMAIPAKPEEIQQVFAIMQMSAEEGARAITDVTSENILVLLHAADSRKMIRNAAKEQADKLFPAGNDSDESGKSNESTGANTGGADT